MSRWHGDFKSKGQHAYGHLAAAMRAGFDSEFPPLHEHLLNDHGIEPNMDADGRWCRDVEAHAAAHGVVMRSLNEL